MFPLASLAGFFTTSVFLAASLFWPAPSAPTPSTPTLAAIATPVQGCSGCLGSGGSAAASGGSCGGMVSVSIDMESGQCRWFMGLEPKELHCRQFRGCKPTVMRSWSGIGAGNSLDFCLTQGGAQFCLDPKPSSGDGSGSDSRAGAEMGCSGDTRSFSIEAPSCGLTASAEATCSVCQSAL